MDVTDPEPIITDSPLLRMDNLIITSHSASASPQAVKKLREDAANAVARRMKGEPLAKGALELWGDAFPVS